MMSLRKALLAGLLAGLVAAIAMTVVMLLLAALGAATPLVIIGDRLSVFIPPGPFLSIMGKVGGYNHLKQLGVGSTILGQLLVGSVGGGIFGLLMRRSPSRSVMSWTMLAFVTLPVIACAVFLWPVLGANYRGLPIDVARFVNLVAFAASVFVFERTLVSGFDFLARESGIGFEPMSHQVHRQDADATNEFTPAIGRRSFMFGAVGVALAGGGVALARKLWKVATFSYDGIQYKGAGVQPITPNDLFYCVTKNVVDPKVTLELWRLEVGGLVQNPATWRYQDLVGFDVHEQETTLMCISNGLDAGLISNARWKGLVLHDLIDQAAPLAGAARVRLHGVDNYTDTIPLEKALDPGTLLAYEMNGDPLPDRHGYPLRAIVPGYFGEKHVKWLTRIELAPADAKGFYETQGWGPDFMTPTRSRIDVPDHESRFALGKINGAIEVKGIAYGGDRGISRVELSVDDGKTWNEVRITYPGTKLTWALWSYDWRPADAGDYPLLVRATDGEGKVQEWDPNRSFFSGITGFHKIVVHVTA